MYLTPIKNKDLFRISLMSCRRQIFQKFDTCKNLVNRCLLIKFSVKHQLKNNYGGSFIFLERVLSLQSTNVFCTQLKSQKVIYFNCNKLHSTIQHHT